MAYFCAWCKVEIKAGKGKGESHGICESCRRAYFPETVKAEPQKAKMGATDCLTAIGSAS